MSSKTDLLNELHTLMGTSTQFWKGTAGKADDFYEVYLWAMALEVAQNEGWTVTYKNAGPSNNDFVFRRGPGYFTSTKTYSYAELKKGDREGELHIGIRVRGESGVLHEFDVVALDVAELNRLRVTKGQPDQIGVRLHIEAKLHKNDLSLGLGRELIGLGLDCPAIHPMLISKADGSPNIRPLVKHHHGTYVSHVYPKDTGLPYIRRCLKYALAAWV